MYSIVFFLSSIKLHNYVFSLRQVHEIYLSIYGNLVFLNKIYKYSLHLKVLCPVNLTKRSKLRHEVGNMNL